MGADKPRRRRTDIEGVESLDTLAVLDLVVELEAIAQDARLAQHKLATRQATTGHSALRRIELRAADAARHARDRLGSADAEG